MPTAEWIIIIRKLLFTVGGTVSSCSNAFTESDVLFLDVEMHCPEKILSLPTWLPKQGLFRLHAPQRGRMSALYY